MIQRPTQLMLAAHQGIGMNLDIDILELGEGGVDHGVEGFAGRIRNQVNMEFLIHKTVQFVHRHRQFRRNSPGPGDRPENMCMT